ncbi:MULTISPECIES: hypothetical protein [unclassified Xanthomonas]|uniref:hypothetical protein n=1 Tax=unclassified Xanthomonas TaxID=2643310 RepID=UPI002A7EC28C|nr:MULTISPECIES: hypothetical protein [unclassified Xanthomonas]MDY4296846.1 hypothetical protein [Xanthomonas sp. LF02-5]MDY4358395.1 hypothetical protein [Xanthomonas sp. LF04-12]
MLQVLVGFYIAALAAVASLHSRALDQKIKADPVYLVVAGEDKKLSRRQFLSLMFGYLSFLSIMLYSSGLLGQILAPNFKGWVSEGVLQWVRMGFIFCYVFLLMQMVFVTLVTLYYLSDRMHWQDPEAMPPEPIRPGNESKQG